MQPKTSYASELQELATDLVVLLSKINDPELNVLYSAEELGHFRALFLQTRIKYIQLSLQQKARKLQ